MACYHPLPAHQGPDGRVFFGPELRGRESVRDLDLPCGQCVGCRLERSRQWAMRCMAEAQMHEHSCFLTLTYDDEHYHPSLNYRDFQLFMKRLRKSAPKASDRERAPKALRFFVCGEYGELNLRPHFHACIFGMSFEDRVLFSRAGGVRTYTSPLLSRLWPFGFSLIGDVTFQSAAYVARYIMKKVTGDLAEAHYRVVNVKTGEIVDRVPEFCHMSLKPGIGSTWYDKYRSDVYPSGKMVSNAVECKPPKFFDRRFKKEFPDDYGVMIFERELQARLRSLDNTNERLRDKEKVTTARVNFLKRSL